MMLTFHRFMGLVVVLAVAAAVATSLAGSMSAPVRRCEPEIFPSDSSARAIEVPAREIATFFWGIENRGCAPLVWRARDLVRGTPQDAPWMTIVPDSGVAPPGGASSFSLVMSAQPGGTFDTDIEITSNDPDHPRVVGTILIFVVTVQVATRRHSFGDVKARYR